VLWEKYRQFKVTFQTEWPFEYLEGYVKCNAADAWIKANVVKRKGERRDGADER